MPTYSAPPYSVDVVQNSIFVDTNVWVSAFNENSSDHDYALNFIESTDKLLLIPISVVAETWGMLLSKIKDVDKSKRVERCIAFLAWLSDPGHNVRLIPEINENVNYILDLSGSFGIDCVDSMLAYLAHTVSDSCEINPFLTIASVDHRDFPAVRTRRNLKYRIYDVVQDIVY